MNKKTRRRIWDIIFVVAIGLILFVPGIRKPVVSTVQRIFAGSPAPIEDENIKNIESYNWRLVDLKGNPINFSKSKGKVTVVNFWATWCPPCIAEMPSFQKLYDKFGDQVDFYFISQEKASTIEQFLQKKEYDFPIYQSKTNQPKTLAYESLPTTFVLNKKGQIVIKEIGAKDWFSNSFQHEVEKMVHQGAVVFE